MKDTHSEKLLQRWEFQKGLYSELWKGLEKRVPTPVGQSLEDHARSTTKQEDQFIKLTSLRNRKATAGDIQWTINNTREQSISKTTVRRRLAACGLRERVARSKPFLRPTNKRKRYLWAKKYKNYTLENWKKVLFTDESQFAIHGNNRRLYVRRRHGERLLNQCLKSTIKHGGGNIQVWGCFSFSGVGSFYRIKGILEKKAISFYPTKVCNTIWEAIMWQGIYFSAR